MLLLSICSFINKHLPPELELHELYAIKVTHSCRLQWASYFGTVGIHCLIGMPCKVCATSPLLDHAIAPVVHEPSHAQREQSDLPEGQSGEHTPSTQGFIQAFHCPGQHIQGQFRPPALLFYEDCCRCHQTCEQAEASVMNGCSRNASLDTSISDLDGMTMDQRIVSFEARAA